MPRQRGNKRKRPCPRCGEQLECLYARAPPKFSFKRIPKAHYCRTCDTIFTPDPYATMHIAYANKRLHNFVFLHEQLTAKLTHQIADLSNF